jgi:hypothetical protein
VSETLQRWLEGHPTHHTAHQRKSRTSRKSRVSRKSRMSRISCIRTSSMRFTTTFATLQRPPSQSYNVCYKPQSASRNSRNSRVVCAFYICAFNARTTSTPHVHQELSLARYNICYPSIRILLPASRIPHSRISRTSALPHSADLKAVHQGYVQSRSLECADLDPVPQHDLADCMTERTKDQGIVLTALPHQVCRERSCPSAASDR